MVNIRIWLEGTLMEQAKKVVCAFNIIYVTGKGSVGKILVLLNFHLLVGGVSLITSRGSNRGRSTKIH